LGLHLIQKAFRNLLNVRAQGLDPPGSKGFRRQAANADVGGRVKKEHLFYQHLGDGDNEARPMEASCFGVGVRSAE
jgi:hypothetical protein